MADPVNAMEGLAGLTDRRKQASARIDELEREWQAANIALVQARRDLVEFERQCGPAAERRTLEMKLVEAEAKAAQPWRERIEGARRGVDDLDAERQRFIADQLDALVAECEAEGEAAAARLTDAARQMVDAYLEREQIAGQIAVLASSVGRVRPGDVSRSRAEEVVRAANGMLLDGGEEPPVLRRDPREPRHGQVGEQVSA